MKALNEKNQKTFDSLQSKSKGKGRMPSVKRIAALFQELGIEFDVMESCDIKQRFSQSNNFATSSGKLVEGWRIKVKNPRGGNIEMDTTCSWFSRNTESFACDFMSVIKFHEQNNQ